MKKQLNSLAKEISVCCGTSCSKQESICSLKELVVEISFFKERYDLMKKTLADICNKTDMSIKAIEGVVEISEKDRLNAISNLIEARRNAEKILLADINSELKKIKSIEKEESPSP